MKTPPNLEFTFFDHALSPRSQTLKQVHGEKDKHTDIAHNLRPTPYDVVIVEKDTFLTNSGTYPTPNYPKLTLP
jgi:hypothetical protein